MAAPAFDAYAACYAYGASAWRLGPLNLSVASGSLTGVIGPNGSGKSTLLALLARRVHGQGEIRFFSRSIRDFGSRAWARSAGYLPQQVQAQFNFTVEEAVAFGRYARTDFMGFLDAHDREVVTRCLAQAEMTALRDRPLYALSGGERQRAHLAAVMAQEPQVLLLDEPTAALDIHHQVALFHLLRQCTDGGMTVILATHDLTLAAHFCDTLLLLSNGQLEASGSPDEVVEQGLIQKVYGENVRVVEHPESGSPVVLPAW
jgi:iron complex transport system ATP-binding protein